MVLKGKKDYYYNNPNVRNIMANKQFCKTVKPFSNELGGNKKTTLTEEDKSVPENNQVAESKDII